MGRASWRSWGAALLLACGAPGFAVADAGLLAPPPAEPYLRAISPDLLPRLERERSLMLPSDTAEPGLAQGLVVFAQPYPRVWSLLAQTERQREYRKELTELTNVERFANGVVDRHRISMLFVRLTYHLRYELDPAAWHIEWSLAPNYENGMQHISGAWDLFDLGGDRTLGRLGSTVRVGTALPRSLQAAITRKNLPETLDNMRRWVDSGGTWRP
jgi:hypothetical protein